MHSLESLSTHTTVLKTAQSGKVASLKACTRKNAVEHWGQILVKLVEAMGPNNILDVLSRYNNSYKTRYLTKSLTSHKISELLKSVSSDMSE